MSLAQVTKETRLTLKIGGAIVALLLIGFLVFQGGTIFKDQFFPKPPAPPENKYGKLAPIQFPQSKNSIPTFKVNTVSGVLPIFPLTINVYKLQQYIPTITALQTGRARAEALGYTQNQQVVSTNVYKWTKTGENNILTYDIVSLNFSVNSDFVTNPTLIAGDLSNSGNLIDGAAGFIDALGADKSDIDFSKSVFSYFFIANSQLTEVKEPASASVAQVYLVQNPIGELPIYYPTASPSLLSVTLSGPKPEDVVAASYNHFTPDLNEHSTYSLKSADQALQELQEGKGYIVRPTTATSVDITDVTLGYYLSDDPTQKYLMPIIVFNGANNFQAYVSAVSN